MISYLQFQAFLFAAETATTNRAIEFSLPDRPWEWIVYGGGFAAVFLIAVLVYARDTRGLNGIWKVWLTALRLAVLAALVVIAVNPQERTERRSIRPSRVAILLDTSQSMRFPEQSAQPETGGTADARSRAAAVEALLTSTPLLTELSKRHDVSVYRFDDALVGPYGAAGGRLQAGTQEADAEGSETGPSRTPFVPGEVLGAGDENLAAINWAELLEPRGVETRLGESLLELVRKAGGETLSGIVVVTDGAANAGVEPEAANEAARSLQPPVRLIAVGVGGTDEPINLQVVNIQAPTDVHLGDGFEISAFLQANGLLGRAAEVELLSRPEGAGETPPTVLDAQTVTLPDSGVPLEVKFSQKPTTAGSYEFFVRAQPVTKTPELSIDDNQRRKAINVVDRKTRVLLIAGGPLRDYRFVRNMLFRHPAVELDVWLQSVLPNTIGMVSQEADRLLTSFPQTAAELVEYDVMIAFDPDWRQISDEGIQNLTEWVSRHGGGMILVAGDVFTPALAAATDGVQPVLDLYPVFLNTFLLSYELDRKADQAWPLEFTRDGEHAGFLELADDPARSADVWRRFAGMYRCYPTAGAKAGATVLATFSDPRTQTEHGPPILLASQFYGAGRTLYVGSAEFWRLRAMSEQYYERFWIKAVRDVAQGRLQRGSSRGMLLMERDQFMLGQTVRVRAQLYDPQLKPLEDEAVTAEVFDPTGKPLVPAVRLTRDGNRPGQYVGDFRAGLAGTYRVEIDIPESTEQLTGKVDVVVPNLESDRPQQNAKLLTDLVRDTGGKYLPLETAAAELPALLPNRSKEFTTDERLQSLWDRQWLLYLLVGLLSLEWLTRKLLRLA